MKVPFVAFGNDQLDAAPPIKAGDTYDCPRCKHSHVIIDSNPPMLLFVTCDNGQTYLVGVKGKNVTGLLKKETAKEDAI